MYINALSIYIHACTSFFSPTLFICCLSEGSLLCSPLLTPQNPKEVVCCSEAWSVVRRPVSLPQWAVVPCSLRWAPLTAGRRSHWENVLATSLQKRYKLHDPLLEFAVILNQTSLELGVYLSSVRLMHGAQFLCWNSVLCVFRESRRTNSAGHLSGLYVSAVTWQYGLLLCFMNFLKLIYFSPQVNILVCFLFTV